MPNPQWQYTDDPSRSDVADGAFRVDPAKRAAMLAALQKSQRVTLARECFPDNEIGFSNALSPEYPDLALSLDKYLSLPRSERDRVEAVAVFVGDPCEPQWVATLRLQRLQTDRECFLEHAQHAGPSTNPLTFLPQSATLPMR